MSEPEYWATSVPRDRGDAPGTREWMILATLLAVLALAAVVVWAVE